MNRRQREKNRATAAWLRKKAAPHCPECGERGRHWFTWPLHTLADVLAGREPTGFWTCSKFYGPDGRRIDP